MQFSWCARAFLLLLAALHLSSAVPHLDLQRNTGRESERNNIRLGCLDASSNLQLTNAAFFVNDTLFYDLENPGRVDDEDRPMGRVVRNRGDIIFTMTRDAEGDYCCGLRSLIIRGTYICSSSRTLVALPTNTPVLTPRPEPINSKLNDEVRIECPQRPGVLSQRYYITWYNATSNQIIAATENPNHPSPSLPLLADSRYRVDDSLALVIRNLTLFDSGLYSCELGVASPQESTVFTYEMSAPIELFVYEPSEIVSRPSSLVLSSEATPNTATFSCSAEGSDYPIITWRHAGVNLTHGDEYSISETFMVTNTRRQRTDSVLVVQELNAYDAGTYECLADTAPGLATNGQRLPGDVAPADLTVLGIFNELEVFITTTSDVIFFLTYPAVFLHPVQLRLRYLEQGGQGRNLTVIPDTAYVSTNEINYIAYASSVPYSRFRVEVSLVHGALEGPSEDNLQVYNKEVPSATGELVRNVLLPTIFPAVVLIGIFVILFLLICLRYCRVIKREKREADREKALWQATYAQNSKVVDQKNEAISHRIDDLTEKLLSVESGHHCEKNFQKLLELVEKEFDEPWYLTEEGVVCRGSMCFQPSDSQPHGTARPATDSRAPQPNPARITPEPTTDSGTSSPNSWTAARRDVAMPLEVVRTNNLHVTSDSTSSAVSNVSSRTQADSAAFNSIQPDSSQPATSTFARVLMKMQLFKERRYTRLVNQNSQESETKA